MILFGNYQRDFQPNKIVYRFKYILHSNDVFQNNHLLKTIKIKNHQNQIFNSRENIYLYGRNKTYKQTKKKTNPQSNKRTNNQTIEQTNKETNEQTNVQTNKLTNKNVSLIPLKAVNYKYDITTVMTTWTRQMGYPVITMRAQADCYHLSQSRFLLDHLNETEVNAASDG